MQLRPLHVLAALALALAACDAPTAGAPPAAEPGELPSRSRELPLTKAIDVRAVAWPERASIDGAVVDRLSPSARDAIALSRLPVMIPRAAGVAEHTKLVVRDAFYSASARVADAADESVDDGGVTVVVSATRVAHRYANIRGVDGPARVRGDKHAFITQNEGIWSVTWAEHGVSYVVEVECSRPGEDARCRDDAFVRSLVEDLAFVGGAFADGGAR